MPNLNKVMLMGNLTRDPEIKYTTKGTAISDLSLAINRVWNNDQNQKQEETTFVDVTLWGRQAELAQQFLQKGQPVYIEGRLQMDTWDDKETGKKRSRMKVTGETIQFLGSKPDRPSAPAPSRPAAKPAPAQTQDDDDFSDVPF